MMIDISTCDTTAARVLRKSALQQTICKLRVENLQCKDNVPHMNDP